jgi:hypothetical protein
MSEITQHIHDYINIANNNIAAAAGDFINNIEDIKLIVDEDQKSIIDRELAIIDAAYQNILNEYKKSIEPFVSSKIRVLCALDNLAKGSVACKKF